ncbi:MAG: type II toxin-antitoxin system prevent-host-death family antitoxin [Candidatus Makaraimicrobium thalassicum]|nr:MAG: type II toxin-antitoxin system prevent-host-death family antitoxin [Candidatus Omnitrophota bacterium]
MISNVWQLQDAKSKFSQLVARAMKNKPQVVTKHGNNAVVILSFEEYQKIIKPKKGLVEFFRDSPLAGLDLDISRSRELPRDIEL